MISWLVILVYFRYVLETYRQPRSAIELECLVNYVLTLLPVSLLMIVVIITEGMV